MAVISRYSKSGEFGTPQDLFDCLYQFVGGFDLDVASTEELAKCEKYITPEKNGLATRWVGNNCWCNPPYTNGDRSKLPEIYYWIEKGYKEILKEHCKSVTYLLPIKTDQIWFREFVQAFYKYLFFIQGRVKFQNQKHGAVFPNFVVHMDYDSCVLRNTFQTNKMICTIYKDKKSKKYKIVL